MRKLVSLLIVSLFVTGIGISQTYQSGSDAQPILAPMRSNYVPTGPGDGLILGGRHRRTLLQGCN